MAGDRILSHSVHLSPEWRDLISCPDCASDAKGLMIFKEESNRVECGSCGSRFAVNQGLINFGVSDSFYDTHGFTSAGRNFSGNGLDRLALYYARGHHLYEISQCVSAGSRVIELGCGGGSSFLSNRYSMLGVEISTSSARSASLTYDSVVQATISSLPVASASVDAIISSFVLEHLADSEVETCLNEMARVLKPGGQMIHYFDLDSDGPFFSWAKKKSWYREIFVDSKGHYGLRKFDCWMKLFQTAGFYILRKRFSGKTWLQDFSIWSALDHPSVKGFPRVLGSWASRGGRKTGIAGAVAVTVADDLMRPFLPDHWGSKVIVCLKKQK
jgi:SAM-dependent methyltransferase